MTDHDDTDTRLRERAFKLGLFGLLASWDEFSEAGWLPTLLACEEAERKKRSLDRRIHGGAAWPFQSTGGLRLEVA